jgi:uncharacterized protein (TIGR00730 family)
MAALRLGSLDAGGHVIGIIPQALVDREVAHTGLSQQIVVGSMHERKAKMAELADGFIVAPGGFGTLEEAFEIITAKQIGLTQKPIVFFDPENFWAALTTFLAHAADCHVLRPVLLDLIIRAASVDDALAALKTAPVTSLFPQKG